MNIVSSEMVGQSYRHWYQECFEFLCSLNIAKSRRQEIYTILDGYTVHQNWDGLERLDWHKRIFLYFVQSNLSCLTLVNDLNLTTSASIVANTNRWFNWNASIIEFVESHKVPQPNLWIKSRTKFQRLGSVQGTYFQRIRNFQ